MKVSELLEEAAGTIDERGYTSPTHALNDAAGETSNPVATLAKNAMLRHLDVEDLDAWADNVCCNMIRGAMLKSAQMVREQEERDTNHSKVRELATTR